MMQSLNQLGIKPHSYEHKVGCDAVDELTRKLNQLAYDWAYTFLSKRAAEYLIGEIRDTVDALRNLRIEKGSRCYDRWVEAGRLGAEWIATLTTYNNNLPAGDDAAVLKREVGKYLKEKDDLDLDGIIGWAKRTKLLGDLYDYSNVPSFERLNRELTDKITEMLKL